MALHRFRLVNVFTEGRIEVAGEVVEIGAGTVQLVLI
jgi:hypothetical protein